VPFRRRAEELAELDAWCGGSGLSVGVLVGPSGTGKTRLAAELCRRQQIQGALTGFLEAATPPESVAALAEGTDPVLLVVDEAHVRADQVAQVLSRLARSPRGAPVRLLLVARQLGNWLRQLRQLCDHADARFAVAAAWIRELGPVDPTLEGREDAFRAATHAFAGR
jgi:hypothetical protein